MAKSRICSVYGCGKQHYARSYCCMCYHQARYSAHLKIHQTQTSMQFLEGLISRNDGECILWPFARDKDGYGKLKHRGRHMQAHRVMCMLVHGAPPDNKAHAAHSCGNGHLGCVNGAHLRWATAIENFIDRVRHGTNANKINEEVVLEIRALAKRESTRALAKKFGMSTRAIDDIIAKRSWTMC